VRASHERLFLPAGFVSRTLTLLPVLQQQHIVQQIQMQPIYYQQAQPATNAHVGPPTVYQTYAPVNEMQPHQAYVFNSTELHEDISLYPTLSHAVPARPPTRGLFPFHRTLMLWKNISACAFSLNRGLSTV